jgi:tetratricopeptide (TPR) repeat protein
MNARSTIIAFAIVLQSAFALAAPRLNFTRTIPAAHGLGHAEHVAVIYAISDNEKIRVFLEDFLDRTNRFGSTRIENVVDIGHHYIGATPDEATAQALRRDHPADAYLGIYGFTCDSKERTAEGSEHDSGGERVKRAHRWIDATCRARVDVMNGAGQRLFSFHTSGQGTSPRAATITPEETNIALEQAAHFAAVSASDAITPRTARESIELDESAPAFDEAYSLIAGDRYADARAIWESLVPRHRDSASLQFDLGAVCEALGDVGAAQKHFEEAQRLVPGSPRYRSELAMFRKRNAVK